MLADCPSAVPCMVQVQARPRMAILEDLNKAIQAPRAVMVILCRPLGTALHLPA